MVIWLLSASLAAADARCANVATGGSVTLVTIGGQPYCVHQFTTAGSGTFNLLRQRDLTYLIVGGGGGGGAFAGGGGGAGGMRTGSIAAASVTPYAIVVGDGGAGDSRTVWPGSAVLGGANGQPSSAFDLTAAGGGGGGTYNTATSVGNGRGGGSGGGASHPGTAGTGQAGQGNAGAAGTSGSGNSSGGGGGGAGQAGQAGTAATAGKGGDGLASAITGTSVVYAGGGAGGGDTRGDLVAVNTGGTGGGGASRNDQAAGNSGLTGRGGGGAGGRISGNNALSTGGSGGSGIVIVRYLANTAPTANAGPDQSARSGDIVTLDGTGSTDPDDNIASYAWTQVGGPAVTLTGAATAQATFTAPAPAGAFDVLVFALTVRDAFDAESTSLVSIDIRPVSAGSGPIGTGGTSVTDFNDLPNNRTLRVHTFTGSGTFSFAGPGAVDYLIVGGGGGGGAIAGGGGGAGGMLTGTETITTGNFPVIVGAGGAGDVRTTWPTAPVQGGANGQSSAFFGYFAAGGGGGGTYVNAPPFVGEGRDGGSGGGSSIGNDPGLGQPGQGTNGAGGTGGNGTSSGGGGGGAATAGQAGSAARAGRGGDGRASTITGTQVFYAGGGAGGGDGRPPGGVPSNVGGIGGGGGSSTTAIGNNGAASFGGGGEGGRAGDNGTLSQGGNGGSGVVIVRYVVNTGPTANAGPAQSVGGLSRVALDGRGSTDPDGDTLIYNWTQTGGTAVTLDAAASAMPGFTAPQPAGGVSEDLTFQLRVTDAFGLTATSDVVITVQGVAVLVAEKTVTVFSENGDGCANPAAVPPAVPALPAAIPGACIEYRITVQNTGVATAEEIVLTDLLPPDLTFAAASLGTGWGQLVTPDAGCATACTVRVQNGVIAAGQTATMTIRARIN